IPRTFVGHDRCIDSTCHLGKTFDAFDRLLEIEEIVFLHSPESPDGLAGRLVALVGVAAERHTRADGFTNPAHHVDVTLGIDADLDLEGADSFLRNLCNLALRLGEIHQSYRMGDGDLPPAGASEQAMDGYIALLAGEVITRELDGRFGI